jgi:radial spoke head protein 3
VVTSNQQREAERLRKEQEARVARERAMRRKEEMNRPSTPQAVRGRQHMTSQTDEYLEELTDRPVEKDVETQTQAFLDRPPSPLFIPAKSGMDKDTQIEVGDLFDFNTEVIPILEVLVGKTLEVAMFEVMEEEEIEALRKRQKDFEKVRNAEVAEVQRLEAEAKRRDDEKVSRPPVGLGRRMGGGC